MRAIIGPNGAGKTTMMDVITGKTRPDAGEVFFNGSVSTHRARRGGDRQSRHRPQVPEADGVREPQRADNLELALAGPRAMFSALFGERNRIDIGPDRRDPRHVSRAPDQRNRVAGELSHGQKQWLEIGMLLAQDPKLLLVDEPVAGMTDAETESTAALLREIAKSHSVIVVEHDMAFVRALGVKVTCLHEGSVLAEGSIDSVSANERVIEVYLGR